MDISLFQYYSEPHCVISRTSQGLEISSKNSWTVKNFPGGVGTNNIYSDTDAHDVMYAGVWLDYVKRQFSDGA